PGLAEVGDAGGSADELDEAALRRYRERKLRLLDSVAEALLQLNPAQEHVQEFKALIETLKTKVEEAHTVAELHRLFHAESSLLLRFAEMVARVLVKAGFTVDMMRECFNVPVPEYGFAGVTGLDADENAKQTLPALLNASADPAGAANGFLARQEQVLSELIAVVRKVALAHQVTLSEVQLKAVALLIWVGGAENLNFTLPLPPIHTDPTPISYTLTGTVVKLESAQILKEQAFKYALQAETVTYAVDGAEKCSPAAPCTIAYLTEKDRITLIKIDANGKRTRSLATLEDCVGAGLVEVQGDLAAVPWKFDDPMPRLPEGAEPAVGTANSGASSGSNGDGSSAGTVDVVPVDPAHPLPWVADPLYVVVRAATILPPPPPPPMRIDGVIGTLAHVTSDGTRIAGVYVFKADDATSPCHNAVARFALRWLDSDNWPEFST
ncbi:MAG TPA: hypothetical protein PKO06_23110, partial [Candidatus Ozemobacteraceae bacterium]|nr:hypothetical protein [Candidatus Ozemobacteraceae bacterium]